MGNSKCQILFTRPVLASLEIVVDPPTPLIVNTTSKESDFVFGSSPFVLSDSHERTKPAHQSGKFKPSRIHSCLNR